MEKLSLSLSQNLNKVGATLLFALIVTLGTMLPFSHGRFLKVNAVSDLRQSLL